MVANEKARNSSKCAPQMIGGSNQPLHNLAWIVELCRELRTAKDTTGDALVVSDRVNVRLSNGDTQARQRLHRK